SAPSEAESAGPEESSEPEPEIVTITVTAAGDCALGTNQKHTYTNSFDEVYDKKGVDFFFDNVRDIFVNDDFSIVNLECSLTNSTDLQTTYYNYRYGGTYAKKWNHKGKPEYIGVLSGSSIEALTLGNNHNKDYGQEGFDETVELTEDAGIVWACEDVLGRYEVKGIKIGFVSVNARYDGQKRAEKFLKAGIETLREDCDLVLACVHWGNDYWYSITDEQKSIGRHCIDWGADMVIGNHPHVVQGIQLYKGKYICYALGNFSYGCNKNPKDYDCMIVQQTFTFVDGVLEEDADFTVIPCRISSVDSKNNYQPTPATGEKAEAIFKKINDSSSQFGLAFDENGKPYTIEN
ncbi:MAG: CapA family protein, partial [Clostridia bacterium]|nr:CapA family protein [Clostridia bacterium]